MGGTFGASFPAPSAVFPGKMPAGQPGASLRRRLFGKWLFRGAVAVPVRRCGRDVRRSFPRAGRRFSGENARGAAGNTLMAAPFRGMADSRRRSGAGPPLSTRGRRLRTFRAGTVGPAVGAAGAAVRSGRRRERRTERQPAAQPAAGRCRRAVMSERVPSGATR